MFVTGFSFLYIGGVVLTTAVRGATTLRVAFGKHHVEARMPRALAQLVGAQWPHVVRLLAVPPIASDIFEGDMLVEMTDVEGTAQRYLRQHTEGGKNTCKLNDTLKQCFPTVRNHRPFESAHNNFFLFPAHLSLPTQSTQMDPDAMHSRKTLIRDIIALCEQCWIVVQPDG